MSKIKIGDVWKSIHVQRTDLPYVCISNADAFWIKYYYLDDKNKEEFYRETEYFLKNFKYNEKKTNEQTIKDIIE